MPKEDQRKESQKVLSNSLIANEKMKDRERSNFLAPLVKESLEEADNGGDSLALVRPNSIRLSAIEKSAAELEDETNKHKELAAQLSMFEEDEEVEPLKPCRMRFRLKWQDQNGKNHNHECDDWETAAAFNRFEKQYGAADAIKFLKQKYEDQYFRAGLVLGFSTHSRRNVEFGTTNQWLLVGLIRLDETNQGDLLA